MKIWFIRHGQKVTNEDNSPLTKKGIKQAKALAKRLKTKTFDEFYCSDFERAKQTASIVSKKVKLVPKIIPALNEFEVEFLKKPKAKWTKEEKEHYNSAISFLKKITKKPDSKKNILIVCHGVTNRIILSHLLNIELKSTIPFMQKETCINKSYWNGTHKNWRIDSWNDSSHLKGRLR